VSARFLDVPVDLDATGALRRTDDAGHLRNLVLAVLLTEPGERVNLPEFGCGIRRLLFAGNADVLQATTQFVVSESLERWLGDAIAVQAVEVTGEESTLRIAVTYAARGGRAPETVMVAVG
jgi:Bacteriophage baseplate protein W